MLERLKRRKDESGFTIIEVLIVLAIAGLIMVVVFLAVPNVQSSQRNNARKSDANNLLQNLSEYIGNANGSLPTTACTGLAACTWVSYKPAHLTNVNYYTTYATGSAAGAPSNSTAYLIGGTICNGTGIAAGTTRDYVVYYGIEGSTLTVCTQGS
jgi:prepilin-type N-terminal cleavage/methylation domain-containing protein